jgi:hypothetical protein
MKRILIYLILTLMVVVTAFVACKKESSDDYFVVDVQNVLGETGGIATVDATFYHTIATDEWEEITLSTAKFNDNGFIMQLPSTLQRKYLVKVNFPNWVEVSDPNAKASPNIYFSANSSSGKGYFWLKGEDINTWIDARYMYADRDYTLKGNKYDLEYNCTFNKGWNIIYYVDRFTDGEPTAILITTQKPADTPVSWVFYPLIHIESQFHDPIFNHNLYIDRK